MIYLATSFRLLDLKVWQNGANERDFLNNFHKKDKCLIGPYFIVERKSIGLLKRLFLPVFATWRGPCV